MTRRLTSSSLAGTLRKLVAVGTSRLASMLVTMRAAAPRSGSPGSSPDALAGAGAPPFTAAAPLPAGGGARGGAGGGRRRGGRGGARRGRGRRCRGGGGGRGRGRHGGSGLVVRLALVVGEEVA